MTTLKGQSKAPASQRGLSYFKRIRLPSRSHCSSMGKRVSPISTWAACNVWP
nr:MAG TPA: hypothetical protein [Caudoviricetes sp.]